MNPNGRRGSRKGGLTNNEKQLIVYTESLQQEEGDSTESVLC